MLSELGVKYVIIGHSERRQYFGETDTDVNRKLHAALEEGLRPIVCLGEKLEVRETGAALDFIRCQLKAALKDITVQQLRKIVIAYEPVWAIGTGKIATPQQAGEAGEAIRDTLRALYGARAANGVIIVTTKRGSSGAPKVTYSGSGGVSVMARRYEMMDATQLMNEANSYAYERWMLDNGVGIYGGKAPEDVIKPYIP